MPQLIMRELFKDLLMMEGVKGALFFTSSGELVFKEFTSGGAHAADNTDWWALTASMEKVQEADLLFEKGRVFMRWVPEGVLVVVAGLIAPGVMIRLHCDVLLQNLKAHRAPKGLKRFFGFQRLLPGAWPEHGSTPGSSAGRKR
jgi:hypothetical protein